MAPAVAVRQPSVLLPAALVMLVAHRWSTVRRLSAEVLAGDQRGGRDRAVRTLPPAGGLRPGQPRGALLRGGHHPAARASAGTAWSSGAGDWTERLARDVEHGQAPARLCVRTRHAFGFMYHE